MCLVYFALNMQIFAVIQSDVVIYPKCHTNKFEYYLRLVVGFVGVGLFVWVFLICHLQFS